MALTNAQRQKKWRDEHRALWNLRRRNLRKGSDLVEKEPEREATVPRIEMVSKEETLRGLRQAIEQESGIAPETSEDAPGSTDTRSRSDIAMGIWRNDQGGVISKFAWDKLQRLKEHAKANNFVIDEYSQ